jgi:hypothetical protein
MKRCDHANFCGKRMAHGDRANGCNSIDQEQCDPVMGSSTTAPAGADDAPYRRCTNCYRVKTRREWMAGSGARMCDCGCFSYQPLPA